jgi:hypothetical protein
LFGVKVHQSSGRKRVVIRKLDKSLNKGFVDPISYLRPDGVEILDREGRLCTVPIAELKAVFFVREFEGNPRRDERKVFQSRPKLLAGLWVRMVFKDNEVLEGLLPNDLLEVPTNGFLITPPDVYSNNVKIFVPRCALAAIHVLGVISGGTVRRTSFRGRDGAARDSGANKE